MEPEEETAVSPATVDDEDHSRAVASWLIVDNETASELSNLLDMFEAPPPPIRVRFIDDPYSATVVFQSSSAYITINGNEESCGSSFSDSDSSVMVSVDLGGAERKRSFGGWGFEFDDCAKARVWWLESSAGAGAGAVDEEEFLEFLVDGCDCDCDCESNGGDAV